ncbi:MAG: N-acetylmuramoyl-L-alanine amidase [Bryobacterales bacterium]|nr:N-acetylmuramoyl-L-alanine amidase [Bryobacterales bacterium]
MLVYRELDRAALRSLDSRADLIRSPVRKLSYLRRMTRHGLPVLAPPRGRTRWSPFLLLAPLLLAFPAGFHTETRAPAAAPLAIGLRNLPDDVPAVWLVDRTEQFETYSNGLRIESLPAVSTHPRRYAALAAHAGGGAPAIHTEPVGIVFHTTETQMVDFEEPKTAALKRIGRNLLEYVLAHRSYHFVVDRFGRVHRVVAESDAANHAGWSVWADGERVYVKLNESFLAVAFETRSPAAGSESSLNSAQIHAGRVLVEMLRSRYGIPASNCVTHAQVSVNPRNLRIGYHTDWSEGFPFRSLGLPDNYALPPASMLLYGFEADGLRRASGVERGVLEAEARLWREARERRMPLAEYRRELRSRWREAISELESAGSNKEKDL